MRLWQFFILFLKTRMAAFLNFLLDENGGSLYFLKMKTSTHFCLRILHTLSEYENSESSLYFFLKWEWGHFSIIFLVDYSPNLTWWWVWWKFSILFLETRKRQHFSILYLKMRIGVEQFFILLFEYEILRCLEQ